MGGASYYIPSFVTSVRLLFPGVSQELSPSLITNPLSALPSPVDYGLALGNLLSSSLLLSNPKILSTQICFLIPSPLSSDLYFFPLSFINSFPFSYFLDQMQVGHWIHERFTFLSLPKIYYYYFVFFWQNKINIGLYAFDFYILLVRYKLVNAYMENS